MAMNLKSINHPSVFSITVGNTSIIDNADAINNSLRLLLLTSKGELLGDPYYGSNIYELIYEPNDDILAGLLTDDILDCIRIYETNIIVTADDITITTSSTTVIINIKWRYQNSDMIGTVTLSIRRLDNED